MCSLKFAGWNPQTRGHRASVLKSPCYKVMPLGPAARHLLTVQAASAHVYLECICICFQKDGDPPVLCSDLQSNKTLTQSFSSSLAASLYTSMAALCFPRRNLWKHFHFYFFSCFETLLCNYCHLCYWEMTLFASSPETRARSPEKFAIWAISQHCSFSGPRSSIPRSVTWLEMQRMNSQPQSSAFVSKGKRRWSKANSTLGDRKGSAGQVYIAPGITFSSGSGNWCAICLA